MARNIQVLILAEDLRQANFVKTFLNERNVFGIRILPLPAGRGCGYDYVIREFPQQIRAMRRVVGASAGLVAVIDSDTDSVEQRRGKLSAALVQAQVTPPGDSECVGVLVAKRNIETWIYHLLGNSVNEQEDFKRQVKDADVGLTAKRFASDCPQNLRDDCPPSLQQGCNDLNSFRQCIRR